MTERRADLLLHPVRVRIVQAIAGREMTTAELADELEDIPQSSLYRHVRVLADAGVLEVTATRPVRGTAERTYALNSAEATLDPDEVAALSPEEHLGYFSAFVGSLMERATSYLHSPGAEPLDDGFSYHVVPVWVTGEELEELREALHDAYHDAAHRGPGEGRRRIMLTTVLIPDA